MQRQTLSAAAALMIAQTQAYKLKPTLAQVQACGVDGRCPVPNPQATSDIADVIRDILPDALPADDTSYAPIFQIDIAATEPIVIQTTDSDDKNVYYVDDAGQTETVVQVVTDEKTGEEVVLINDVVVQPIVIENFGEQDTKVVITQDSETNQQTTYIVEHADSTSQTVTEVTKTEETLVEVAFDEIEVIATDTTVVTPVFDDQDNVVSICVTNSGDSTCTDVEETVIEPTTQTDVVIDVQVPADTVVKVVEGQSEDIEVHVNPENPTEVIVDIGNNDPEDLTINVVIVEDSEQPVIVIDEISEPEPYNPEIIADDYPIIGAWLEFNDNGESRQCTVSSGCSEWEADPNSVPQIAPVVIEIEVPEDTVVITIDTDAVSEPTVIEVQPDPSDSSSPSTVVVDTAGFDDSQVQVIVIETKEAEAVTVTVNDVVTPTIAVDGQDVSVVFTEDATSTTTYVVDQSSEQPVVEVLVPAEPVYVEVNTQEYQEATTEQDVVATVETVVNEDGDITALVIDGTVQVLEPYVAPEPAVLVPEISQGEDVTPETNVVVVPSPADVEPAVLIAIDDLNGDVVVVYTPEEQPVVEVIADKSGEIIAVVVNGDVISPVVIGELDDKPAVIINQPTDDTVETLVIEDTTTGGEPHIVVVDPSTATVVEPEQPVVIDEDKVIDVITIQADPTSPSGVTICNENNKCEDAEPYVNPQGEAGDDITDITPVIVVETETDNTTVYIIEDKTGEDTVIVVTPDISVEIEVISQDENIPLVVIDEVITVPIDLNNVEDNSSIVTVIDPVTEEPTTVIVQDKEIQGVVEEGEIVAPEEPVKITTETVVDVLVVTVDENDNVVVQNLIDQTIVEPQTQPKEEESVQITDVIIPAEDIDTELPCEEELADARAEIAEQDREIAFLEA